jgi:hypothetical protein
MMRWSISKPIWERCRFTETDLNANATNGHTVATCLFCNVGTTVPETVTRHIYGLIMSNVAATFNNVRVFHVPDGQTGTQYLIRDAHLSRGGDSGSTAGPRTLFYPPNPDPLKPIIALEGGSKLYASSATASMRVTVLYWDDILTGIEDT